MTSPASDLHQKEEREIAPGVMLYREYEKVVDNADVTGIFTWKVELTTMNVVDFEVNLEQSENIEVLDNKSDNEYKTISRIQPFETKEVAKVLLKNEWRLKSKFKLTMNIPDKAVQYNYIMKDDKALEKAIKDNTDSLSLIPFEHLTKEQCDSELEKLKIKFIDLDFLPNDDAVINSHYDENTRDYLEYIIHWRRPEEFIKLQDDQELKVFNYNNEPEPNDIHQGNLPDIHLASAFSALAEKYNLIKRLFKSEKYSKYGIYQVKLCVNGEWVTVVVDDLFPCIPLSDPMVSRSQSNELWILILEKAMAKVFECYYYLTTTNISDFLQVLTGCPTLFFSIEDMLKLEERDSLLKKLKQYVVDKKYLTVAVSKVNENELAQEDNAVEDDMLTIQNFGYTIIDVKTKYKENLIVMRKVWYDGAKEANVKKYEENLVKENPLLENETSEGTLILAFEDFLKEFSSFAVCYAKNWDEVRIRGKFVMLKEQESNLDISLSKWYYCIQLDKPTNLIISLFQDEDKAKDDDSRKQLMDISITILKQDSTKNEITHIKTLDFAHSSNIQTELNLPTGSYIILPRTSGCFFGRPFEKQNVTTTPLYDYEEKKFNPVFIATIKDIFKKFDLLLNRKIGFNEFKGFWECIKRETINEKFFKDNILSRYQCHEEGITEQGFIKYFKETFFTEEGEKTIREWLHNLGYDTNLYALRSRCFMLTFHSDLPISVTVRDALNTDLNNKVNRIILKSLGEEIKKKRDITAVQYQSKSNGIITLGCVNRGIVSYRVVITFPTGNSVLFSSKDSKIEKIIQPGCYEYFMHYFVLFSEKSNENIDFSLDYYPIN